MQLNDNLARQIVARAMKILSFSVNVMDEHGLIIASGNPERIHQRHEGAVLALTENRVVEISEATALQLKGVRPGINLPISYQGELIGVIGISGDPEEVRAYAELVRMTAELILEQAAITDLDRDVVDQIFDTFVRDFSGYATALHGKASSTEAQQAWAVEHLRKPVVDDERTERVFERVKALSGAYAMKP